jgi:hypothetical protein
MTNRTSFLNRYAVNAPTRRIDINASLPWDAATARLPRVPELTKRAMLMWTEDWFMWTFIGIPAIGVVLLCLWTVYVRRAWKLRRAADRQVNFWIALVVTSLLTAYLIAYGRLAAEVISVLIFALAGKSFW